MGFRGGGGICCATTAVRQRKKGVCGCGCACACVCVWRGKTCRITPPNTHKNARTHAHTVDGLVFRTRTQQYFCITSQQPARHQGNTVSLARGRSFLFFFFFLHPRGLSRARETALPQRVRHKRPSSSISCASHTFTRHFPTEQATTNNNNSRDKLHWRSRETARGDLFALFSYLSRLAGTVPSLVFSPRPRCASLGEIKVHVCEK